MNLSGVCLSEQIDLEVFRSQLQHELQKLAADLAEAERAAQTVKLDQASVGRLSRMDAMQQQAMAQGLREHIQRRQRQVQAAMARIESGTYGRCCGCETPLSAQRLERDPAVVFCADCLAERERR